MNSLKKRFRFSRKSRLESKFRKYFSGEVPRHVSLANDIIWSRILPFKTEIITVHLKKQRVNGNSLGFSLKSSVDDEEDPYLVNRHFIQKISAGLPAAISKLIPGDELLEINGLKLYGRTSLDVLETLKNSQKYCRLVIARSSLPYLNKSRSLLSRTHSNRSRRTDSYGSDSYQSESDACLDEMSEIVSISKTNSRSNSSIAKSVQDEDKSYLIDRTVVLKFLNIVTNWSNSPILIQLQKQSNESLGLSITTDGNRVLVMGLVPEGLAHRDGRIAPGDCLVFVNHHTLNNLSVVEAAKVLRDLSSIRPVLIGIKKPLQLNANLIFDFYTWWQSDQEEDQEFNDITTNTHKITPISNSEDISLQAYSSSKNLEDIHRNSQNFPFLIQIHNPSDKNIPQIENENPENSLNHYSIPQKHSENFSTNPLADSLNNNSLKVERSTSPVLFPEKEVIIYRDIDSRPLGLSIIGNETFHTDDLTVSKKGVLIKTILAGSPADKCKSLKSGDRILMVNNYDLTNATHEEAIMVIRKAASPIKLRILPIDNQEEELTYINDFKKLTITSEDNHESLLPVNKQNSIRKEYLEPILEHSTNHKSLLPAFRQNSIEIDNQSPILEQSNNNVSEEISVKVEISIGRLFCYESNSDSDEQTDSLVQTFNLCECSGPSGKWFHLECGLIGTGNSNATFICAVRTDNITHDPYFFYGDKLLAVNEYRLENYSPEMWAKTIDSLIKSNANDVPLEARNKSKIVLNFVVNRSLKNIHETNQLEYFTLKSLFNGSQNDFNHLFVENYEIFEIQLERKDNENFGFILVNKGTFSHPKVYVKMILNSGSAFSEGTMRVNDRILLINNINTEQLDYEQILGLINNSSDKIEIFLGRFINQVRNLSSISKGYEFHVILNNDNSSGINIIGGTDTALKHVYICKIPKVHSPDKDVELKIGDRILAVDKFDMTNCTHAMALSVFSRTKSGMRLKLYREFIPPEQSNVLNVFNIYLELDESGLSLNFGSKTQWGFNIIKVDKNTQAISNDQIRENDILMEINGHSVLEFDYLQLMGKLKLIDGKCLLLIGRPKSSIANQNQSGMNLKENQLIPWPTSNSQDVSPSFTRSMSQTSKLPKSIYLQLNLNICKMIHQASNSYNKLTGIAFENINKPDIKIPILLQNIKSTGDGNSLIKIPLRGILVKSIASTKSTCLVNILNVGDIIVKINDRFCKFNKNLEELNKHAPIYRMILIRKIPNCQLNKSPMFRSISRNFFNPIEVNIDDNQSVSTTKLPDLSASFSEINKGIKTVNLVRGKYGFGLNLIGGYGTVRGNLPIFVHSIQPGSMADLLGIIRVGDKIWEINNEIVANKTLTEVQQILNSVELNQIIKLTII